MPRICRLATSPVVVDISAHLDFANRRVAADRAPDLSLELTGSNVIAEEGVVYRVSARYCTRRCMSLTAVEAARVVDVVGAVADGATDAGRVAPDHLGEVAPGVFVVGVVVRVLGFLLVPAVGGSAGELDPIFVLAGSGADRREVAARALLYQCKCLPADSVCCA
jgi:hypothetical protein